MLLTPDFSFEQVMRLSSIERWGIIEMSKSQSVAEHSYNVGMIAHAIGSWMNLHESYMYMILKQSLVHDLPELVTGDIPTPFKKALGDGYSGVEEKLFPSWAGHKDSVPPVIKNIIKLADLIDAIQFAQKFCVDSRKVEIISEMKIKMGDVAMGVLSGHHAIGLLKVCEEWLGKTR